MGQKQARKKHERRVKDLVATAEKAATRAEKAARKARRERKRAAEALRPAPGSDAGSDAAPVATAAAPSEPAAAPTSELESATKAELMDRAQAADITGRGSMTKAQLVTALGG